MKITNCFELLSNSDIISDKNLESDSMYEYFSELETLSNFKTYLLRETFDKNQDCSIREIPFSIELIKQLEILFPKFK